MRKSLLALVAGLGALAAAGAVYASAADRSGGEGTTRVGQFSDQGVNVTLSVKDQSRDQVTLTATFTPQSPGYHLYSIDMPADGIHGVGRPTRLAVQGMLTATGPLTAEATATMMPLAGTTLSLPVYPDGPVTVELRVGITGKGDATALVGYAACSPANCLPPVTAHPIHLHVDGGVTAATG